MAKAKYKAGKDGAYRTKAWDGTYNEDGSKHRINLKSEKSSADLEKQVNNLRNKIRDGAFVQQTDILFIDYAKTWKKTYKCVRSTATQNMYSNIIDTHFKLLDGIKLADLRKSHVQLVINNAIDKPRTCQQIQLTIKQVVQAAVKDKLMAATSVDDICTGISLPKYRPNEKRPLTAQELKAIKVANFTDREKAFVLIILGCGLRRGEALALKKDLDIDLKASTLTVRQSVEFDGNKSTPKSPKSDNGYRTVPMPGFLCEYLKRYLPAVNGPYVISNQDGNVMTKSGYRKMWDSILNKINLAAGGTGDLKVIYGLTAHVFRHNYCTNLCYQIPKISTKKIAQLLGDTEAMVIKVYSHIVEEKENVSEVVNDAICL